MGISKTLDDFRGLFERPLDSRLYVDILYQHTSQLAIFSPATVVKIGDYGRISRRTGQFIRKGNIFELDVLKDLEPPELKEIPDGNQQYSYSKNEQKDFSVDVHGEALGHVSGSVKMTLKYDKDVVVTLMLRDPVNVEIDFSAVLTRLARFRNLKGFAIVTQYTKCTTYAIHLTKGKAGDASISFTGDAPVPHVPGIVGGGAQGAWSATTSAGTWKTGGYEPSNHRYIPLCVVHKISNGEFKDGNVRDGNSRADGQASFQPVDTPWGALDGHGLEIGVDEEDDSDLENWGA